MTLFNCKECDSKFESLKSLHAHFKKHDMLLGDYYVKHFGRRNKLTGQLLEFKNYDDYFEKDFSNHKQMIEWCKKTSEKEAKQYLIDCLKKRIIKKNLKYAPNTIELFTANLPTMEMYKTLFGSYSNVCSICDIEPMFKNNLPAKFHDDYGHCKIYIDTREQKPLSFANSEKLKLDVGDYAVSGDSYCYTYVDRKSFADLCGTVTVGYDRFKKEMQRCRDVGGYMFIVVEEDLYQMEEKNKRSPKKFNLSYVFSKMRDIQNEYKDCCQFLFSGNRVNSEKLIPKLLVVGKDLWHTDMQYFLDQNALNKK